MKFLLALVIQLILGVSFMYYLTTVSSFTPYDNQGHLVANNVLAVFVLIFLCTQALFTIMIYLFQRIFIFENGEKPSKRFSYKWGFVLALIFIAIVLLHMFHILTFEWGIATAILIIIGMIFLH